MDDGRAEDMHLSDKLTAMRRRSDEETHLSDGLTAVPRMSDFFLACAMFHEEVGGILLDLDVSRDARGWVHISSVARRLSGAKANQCRKT